MQALPVSAVHAVVKDNVQENNYDYKLWLSMITFRAV